VKESKKDESTLLAEKKSAEEYPAGTVGSEMAKEGRKECNKLSDSQRDELTNAALAMIYAEQGAGQATGA